VLLFTFWLDSSRNMILVIINLSYCKFYSLEAVLVKAGSSFKGLRHIMLIGLSTDM